MSKEKIPSGLRGINTGRFAGFAVILLWHAEQNFRLVQTGQFRSTPGKSKRGQQSWSTGSRQRCLFSLEADDIYEFVARIIIN